MHDMLLCGAIMVKYEQEPLHSQTFSPVLLFADIENPKAAAAEVMSTEKLLAGAAFTDVEKRDVHLYVELQ
ncbi:hypothetical protein SARC_17615, partial [Sphaeroforma arctica JP610]